MAEDLLTTILAFIYTTVHGIGEKIAGLIRFISGVALPSTIVDAIGLLVILMILLAIAWVAKKSIRRVKKSAAEATPEPQIEKQIETETGLEQKTEKKVIIPESHIEKKVTIEATPEPPIPEQRMEEKEKVTKEIIPEKKRYPEAFASGSVTTRNGNNLEHIFNELHKIEMIISEDADDFMGLYIPENEMNAMVHATPHELNAESDSVKQEIQTKFMEITRSLETEISPQLHSLKDLFHLDAFEVNALLICLASELYLRCEKVNSYLHNDVTKKRPTVYLVINLLSPSMKEKLEARSYFSPNAALIKNRIIYLIGDEPQWHIPLLSRPIKVDERIINYLLGKNEIDQKIMNFSYMLEPKRSFDELILAEDVKNTLKELVKHRSINPMFFFHGAYGTGRKLTAEVICNDLKIPLLIVDSRGLMKGDSLETLKIIIREACLQHSSLYLEGFDALLEKDAGVNVTGLIQELDNFPNWVFLSGELPYTPAAILEKHSFIDMAFPIPSSACRKDLWEFLLKEIVPEEKLPDDLDIDALVSKFNFSGGQIKDAIITARNTAMVKKPEDYKLSMEDLYRGCKAQSNKNLSSFAKNVPPRYTWNDIVLPKDIKEQLIEVSGHIKHKVIVYDDWGFDTKLSLGKGLNVLFSGPSGAGKTMAAEVIAKEAGLDIYKIDLSTVVSKYIGETEKILKKIFTEAETSNAILFFDEADALFGKRSEVKDSHDRYANIEINYLLQKMEEHDGIAILASNFKSNIDDAFLRRMHFVIEFPFPDEELRKRIWVNIFPKETPVDKPQFFVCDIKDASSLKTKLRNAKDTVSQYIREQLSPDMQMLISKSYETSAISDFKKGLVDELNKLITSGHLFDKQRFSQVKLREETKRLLEQNPEGEKLILLNRLLLEDAYPHEIAGSSIDFDFLSKFKLTGGNIKNIALSAAFLAAEDSCAVRMRHIIRATKREFQKMGKLCTPEEFGEYYELIK